tara:strand:+ start:387 stop:1190 length:804 start_codon:yes stop_codon:yes gene_type:complete
MTTGSVQISNEDYHASDAISASMQKTMVKHGPKAYWNCYLNPDRPEQKPTAAMLLGTLTHCAVLEPDELTKRFVAVSSRTTKKGKEEAKEAEEKGIIPVTEADMTTALKMRDAVFAEPHAKKLLNFGVAEKSYWWEDTVSGLTCRCRPDWLNKDTIIDLKTSRSGANPIDFGKAVANLKYHLQAKHYLNGIPQAKHFIFLVVQSEYPYDVGLWKLDDDALKEGQVLSRSALNQIAQCRLLDDWPSWCQAGVKSLSLPRWAYSTPIEQ